MSSPHLRLVRPESIDHESHEQDQPAIDESPFAFEPEHVAVNAGETIALLMHAARTNRTWLQDFADETLQVPRDLYEVLLAYRRIVVEEHSRAA